MIEVFIILFCLVINALFAAYEIAFVAVSRPELQGLAKNGNKHAQRLLILRMHPERTLSIIQVGLTLSSAIAAAVGGVRAVHDIAPYFMEHLGISINLAKGLSVVLVVVPLTYLTVVLSELVPKSLALRNPVRIVLQGADALFLLDRIFAPAVTALEWSTKLILNIFFQRAKPVALQNIDIKIDDLSKVHQKFMMNMADIEKKRIRDIFVPWDQVNSVMKTDSINEVSQMVMASSHTRLPVLDGNRVIGILHTKEFIILRESGAINWHTIIRQVLKIQTTDSALGVLRLMQEQRNHMTIVFSPFGERLGIVTLEDIMEQIFGDIFDEDDDGIVRKIFATRVKNRMISDDEFAEL